MPLTGHLQEQELGDLAGQLVPLADAAIHRWATVFLTFDPDVACDIFSQALKL